MKGRLCGSCYISGIIALVLCLFISFTGCTTSQPAPEQPKPEPEKQKVQENVEPMKTEQVAPQKQEKPAEPTVKTTDKNTEITSKEKFVVSDEVFSETFSDVQSLIQELNTTISNENYTKWLTYLTSDYKKRYSDTDVLGEISQRPTLKKYNIRLTTLEDYFKYVVVPSRSDVRLDDLVFEDNNHVKAIMIINNQRVILYQLEKIDGEWKIAT